MKLSARRDQLLPSSGLSERGNDSIYIVPRPPPPNVKIITILVPRAGCFFWPGDIITRQIIESDLRFPVFVFRTDKLKILQKYYKILRKKGRAVVSTALP